MQVFVPRVDLTGAADEVVRVFASYEDSPLVPTDLHGEQNTVLALPSIALVNNTAAIMPAFPIPGMTPSGPPPVSTPAAAAYTVKPNWRVDFKSPVIAGEANRRVLAVFPEYSQRNASAEMNNYITQYGADATTWPAAAKSRKAEMDRCWTYVNAVRNTANSMGQSNLPTDPSGDGNWPTRVPSYQPL